MAIHADNDVLHFQLRALGTIRKANSLQNIARDFIWGSVKIVLTGIYQIVSDDRWFLPTYTHQLRADVEDALQLTQVAKDEHVRHPGPVLPEHLDLRVHSGWRRETPEAVFQVMFSQLLHRTLGL